MLLSLAIESVLLVALVAVTALVHASREVDPTARVDCAPRLGDTQNDCLQRGCVWDQYRFYGGNYFPTDPGISTRPYCYFPRNTGYSFKNQSKDGQTINVQRLWGTGGSNPYGADVPELRVRYNPLLKGSMLHVSIGNDGRYTPPVPLNTPNTPYPDGEGLVFRYQTSPIFTFTVERAKDGTRLWDTSIGGLLFAEQYIQIATYLPSVNHKS